MNRTKDLEHELELEQAAGRANPQLRQQARLELEQAAGRRAAAKAKTSPADPTQPSEPAAETPPER